jgi:cell filamentation protein
VFSILLARHLGFTVDHNILKQNSSYVRNSLVMASNGIYSKFDYLDRIFFDAILHEDISDIDNINNLSSKYESIEIYNVKDYKDQQHEYRQ